MNEYRIAFTHLARKDIIDIGDYITFTLSEPTTSGKFIKGLKHSISQLKISRTNILLFKILFYKIRAFVVCLTKITIFSTKLLRRPKALLSSESVIIEEIGKIFLPDLSADRKKDPTASILI